MDINRIILSRKGFDSAAGGYPNIILPDGRLISFPIPEDCDTNITYSDLYLNENLTYKDLMKQLGMKDVYNKHVHLDPDIYINCKKREKEWNAIFGQTSSAQTHLSNNQVNVNDIFLFFGWFRNVEETKDGYKYIKGTDKHIIFGYLQIGEIINIDVNNEYPLWMTTHPHFYRKLNDKNNTAYIAKDKLTFSDNNGFGVFNYHESLVLTKDNGKKSIWKLPTFFHPSNNTIMTFHTNEKLWTLYDDHCVLESVGRGQEFILMNNKNIVDWAKDIIVKNK